MKINFFNRNSVMYPFRWYIILLIAAGGLMTYADITGWRLLSLSSQEQWNASGPGSHK